MHMGEFMNFPNHPAYRDANISVQTSDLAYQLHYQPSGVCTPKHSRCHEITITALDHTAMHDAHIKKDQLFINLTCRYFKYPSCINKITWPVVQIIRSLRPRSWSHTKGHFFLSQQFGFHLSVSKCGDFYEWCHQSCLVSSS